ncbi:MAG: hypothetical protein SWO11_10675 [Thermodesulfobacteriota bacterium]|nr:hypothetical protein [Thermodesulfobacteriota bacterium]
MKTTEKERKWPAVYEPPRVHHIETAYQQAMGITYCAAGTGAGGGEGTCTTGGSATGLPGEPNACQNGSMAHVGPGGGNSPCGAGASACAMG